MTRTLLVLRPQPGAGHTAQRAAAAGFETVVAPLFSIQAVDWTPPDATAIAAVAMTSANAARRAGPALARFTHLPLWAVGAATAEAARAAGFRMIHAGVADAAALAMAIGRDCAGTVLHLAGEDHRPLGLAGVVTRIVYRAATVTALPAEALVAARGGAVALLHSPRAAARWRALVETAGLDRTTLSIAAISPAALTAAGCGWAASATATIPRDDALLAAAARLCDHGGGRDAAWRATVA